jgi:murein DD-endopeptidase MepM/ murein hydrolase activator NlpD
MAEKDLCPDNKYLFAFFTVLIIMISIVCCITAVYSQMQIPSDLSFISEAAEENADKRGAVGCVDYNDRGDCYNEVTEDEVTGETAEKNIFYDTDTSALQTYSIVFPLDGNITSLFAYRTDPFYNPADGGTPACEFHRGIDISAARSRDVRACADGVVIFAGYDSSYGKYIMIEHESFVSLYAHCDSLLCAAGDNVRAGDSIAVAGSTGRSTGPHLHFEIRVDGECVDPLDFVGCVYTGTIY